MRTRIAQALLLSEKLPGVDPLALKSSLPRTWGAFFGRHGNFTSAQLAGIPPLLSGENVLISAPTASGKTEAALAPLIERYVGVTDEGDRTPPSIVRRPSSVTILYLLPTRALISDLYGRLAAPLEALRVTLAVRTHDFNTFDPKRPADVLLTTPESLDALLVGHAAVLAGVRATIIDELHIFDGTPRGDQLRVLLNRLRQVRSHAARVGDAQDEKIQYVGLSATLAQPEIAASRYFPDVQVVQVSGQRTINAELIALDADSTGALLDYLSSFRQRGWRKGLAFCNTRSEVENYAAAVRTWGSPFGQAVYVHYSNLSWERRSEIEQQFAQAQAALCFASSTLELGIDIGDIDVSLLIGAPGNTEAFIQRVGRANRRKQTATVACFYRTPLERIAFGALLRSEGEARVAPTEQEQGQDQGKAFRPSVAVQQIFSLLRQSPTGALRLNPLADLFDGMLSADDLRSILGTLQALGYLRGGRAGEWRAGARLNRLVDLQSAKYSPLSLYSNIKTTGGPPVDIRNQHSGRVVATVDQQWFDSNVLTLEGRALNVEWYDGESLWVSANRGEDAAPRPRFLSARQVLSYDLARRFPTEVGLPPASAPLVEHNGSWLWFHWLGDIYGKAVLDLLRYTLSVHETPLPGLCLMLRDELGTLSVWTQAEVERYLRDNYRGYEMLLELGPYHHLLPVELRRRAVIEQFDAPAFIAAIKRLHIVRTPEALRQDLQELIGQ